jgi:predicted phosphohydrolase
MSDLHLERPESDMRPLSAQLDDKDTILMLAGDIGSAVYSNSYMPFLLHVTQMFKHVIMIAGNHEYYHTSKHSAVAQIKDSTHFLSNFTLLDDENIIIDDIMFIGSTLWTNFGGYNVRDMIQYAERSNDVVAIKHFTANVAYAAHDDSCYYIFAQIARAKDMKTVVMTHHAPSYQSADEFLIRDNMVTSCTSNLEWLIKDHKPSLWIHGHVHANFDYLVGETRIVANTRGYVGGYMNPDFNSNFTVEI